MCGLLSNIRVPLPCSDPSPPPTQMVGFLHWDKSAHTLVQTVLITFLINSPVQINSPDINPFPALGAHDLLLALSLLACNVSPEQLGRWPITARGSELVLKDVILEDALSTVCVVAQGHVGVDKPVGSPPPSRGSREELLWEFHLSGHVGPLGSGHGSGCPLAQQGDLVLVCFSEHRDLSIKGPVLDTLGMVLQTHPDEDLEFSRELPLPLRVTLVWHRGPFQEHGEHVTTEFSTPVCFGREHDLVGGDPVVSNPPVSTQHPDYHVGDTVLGLWRESVVLGLGC